MLKVILYRLHSLIESNVPRTKDEVLEGSFGSVSVLAKTDPICKLLNEIMWRFDIIPHQVERLTTTKLFSINLQE